MLDVNQVGRKAPELVPCDDIVRGVGDDFPGAEPAQSTMRDVAEADTMTVTQEASANWYSLANG
jgi:hypothetical protein